ncbi:MAG: hypothetical protein EHM80_13525 [Nitrospiraceae bacterium]|nr:MAG: hypothetical protein EHM80_13525 [Nitrospiraceae bacterium]
MWLCRGAALQGGSLKSFRRHRQAETHDRIIDGKTGKQCARQFRTGKHFGDELVGPTDRPAITTCELAQDRVCGRRIQRL